MRRTRLAGLLAAAVCVTFAAVAFACTPQANIGLDRPAAAGNAPVYATGESAIVLGYGFDPNSPSNVVIRIDGAEVTSAPIDADGRVRAAFVISGALQPGPHVVTADAFDERGLAFRPAAGFAVAEPQPVAAAAPAADATTAAPAANQPAAGAARPPGAVDLPSRRPSPKHAGTRAPHRRSPASAGGGVGSRRTVPASPIVAVAPAHRGSVPAASSSPARARIRQRGAGSRRARPARGSRARVARPAPARSPGLESVGAPGSDAGPGAAFAVGVGLMGGGLLLLLGGVLVVEVRRGKVRVRAEREP